MANFKSNFRTGQDQLLLHSGLELAQLVQEPCGTTIGVTTAMLHFTAPLNNSKQNITATRNRGRRKPESSATGGKKIHIPNHRSRAEARHSAPMIRGMLRPRGIAHRGATRRNIGGVTIDIFVHLGRRGDFLVFAG